MVKVRSDARLQREKILVVRGRKKKTRWLSVWSGGLRSKEIVKNLVMPISVDGCD